jgi:catalase
MLSGVSRPTFCFSIITHLASDYLSSNPESLYQVMRLFSDLGTPASFRTMNGWSGHTYRLIQADGSWVYAKVAVVSDQGIKNHTNAEATELGGSNPDFLTQDLFNAIESGDYPSWTVNFQTMTAKQAEKYKCTCEVFSLMLQMLIYLL